MARLIEIWNSLPGVSVRGAGRMGHFGAPHFH
jgi:hypothetical protein